MWFHACSITICGRTTPRNKLRLKKISSLTLVGVACTEVESRLRMRASSIHCIWGENKPWLDRGCTAKKKIGSSNLEGRVRQLDDCGVNDSTRVMKPRGHILTTCCSSISQKEPGLWYYSSTRTSKFRTCRSNVRCQRNLEVLTIGGSDREIIVLCAPPRTITKLINTC